MKINKHYLDTSSDKRMLPAPENATSYSLSLGFTCVQFFGQCGYLSTAFRAVVVSSLYSFLCMKKTLNPYTTFFFARKKGPLREEQNLLCMNCLYLSK